MRVLMLGWEFPPLISGGLGIACHGLVKALGASGTDVLFILPRPAVHDFNEHVTVAQALPTHTSANQQSESSLAHVTFRLVEANLQPYSRPEGASPDERVGDAHISGNGYLNSADDSGHSVIPMPSPMYGSDLFGEVQRFATHAEEIAADESFDVIHAHDWMTFPAGLAIAAHKGRPLVVHIHSTELDRAGENVDQRIYDIERRGLHSAIRVIAVSYFTKDILVKHYGVDPDKIDVVYNAIENDGSGDHVSDRYSIHQGEKIVLFLGRLTFQKGPEYFLSAAKKVLSVMDNVKFVVAGSGDMMRQAVELAAEFGIGHKVLFTGFLRGPDVERVFRMADLYVMPSVSEPFGIAPLEAIANDVPVIISKQSGVSEVLPHALKVDFWDTHEMANKIVAVLRHRPLAMMLREQGTFELSKLSWADSARTCIGIYDRAISAMK